MVKQEPSILERIKALDEEKSKLLEGAKNELLDRANAAITELNALGYNYSLREGAVRTLRGEGTRQGTRQIDASKPCAVCGFQTQPPHDARSHRSQHDKKPFTAQELRERGYEKV